MNKKGVIIAAVALLVIGGGAYALTQNSEEPSEASNSAESDHDHNDGSHSHDEEAADTSSAVETSTITYTDDGFSPSTVTVKAGTTITVKNNSSSPLQFSSDPHPAHTDEDELNLSTLSPGASTTFVATETGSHGFHNHLNEDASGTLIVQ